MKRSTRLAWLGVIVLVMIILLTLIVAPSSKINSGSTFSRSPDGYGAWYAFMQQQGIPIKRWQKSVDQIPSTMQPATLLQINGQLSPASMNGEAVKWLDQGNTLVILGVREQVTAANFRTKPESNFGEVIIDTTRRHQVAAKEKVVLGDRFGAMVWETKYSQGQLIYATTPHLAANAYQDNLSNFQFLADLVQENQHPILVDEYIHGYKDADIKKKEGQENLLSYLAKTPLLPISIQLIILLLILIWAQNRRFGKPETLEIPVIDNSEAYIQALAGVLQKAESRDFVLEMVGKQEQLQLQTALGLGPVPLEEEDLVNLWIEKTGASAVDIHAVLKIQSQKQSISERDLVNWLRKWQSLREQGTGKFP